MCIEFFGWTINEATVIKYFHLYNIRVITHRHSTHMLHMTGNNMNKTHCLHITMSSHVPHEMISIDIG
jgi:hypothetical protein